MSAKDMTNREDKLPQWVQTELKRLRSNVLYWRDKAQVTAEKSNTFINDGDIGEDGTPLGMNTSIKFKMDGRWTSYFDVHIDPSTDELVVRGGDNILVQPHSGNVIRVRISG